MPTLESSVCVNVYPNSVSYLVIRDPDGGLLNRDVDGNMVADDNDPKIKWQANAVPSKSDAYKLVIILTRTSSALRKTAGDTSCPDGGNISVTLTGGTGTPPPVAPIPASYTNDAPQAYKKTK